MILKTKDFNNIIRKFFAKIDITRGPYPAQNMFKVGFLCHGSAKFRPDISNLHKQKRNNLFLFCKKIVRLTSFL